MLRSARDAARAGWSVHDRFVGNPTINTFIASKYS
jgi:hypothetical protein